MLEAEKEQPWALEEREWERLRLQIVSAFCFLFNVDNKLQSMGMVNTQCLSCTKSLFVDNSR
jgi:hypothetical protein